MFADGYCCVFVIHLRLQSLDSVENVLASLGAKSKMRNSGNVLCFGGKFWQGNGAEAMHLTRIFKFSLTLTKLL